MRPHWLSFLILALTGFSEGRGAENSLPVAPARGEMLDDYMVDVWTTEHGLPQNSVNAVAQTPDGYLWLATFNGLARFDGVRFQVFNTANTPQLRGGRLTKLLVDRAGILWIVSEVFEVTRYAKGVFTEEVEGIPEGGIRQMHMDGDGRVWFVSSKNHGFFHHVNGRFIHVFDASVTKRERPFQVFWGYGPGEIWSRFADDVMRIVPADLESAPSLGERTTGMGPDLRGKAIASTPTRVMRFDEGRWHELGRFEEIQPDATQIIGSRDGAIWGASYSGRIWKYDGSRLRVFGPSQARIEFRCVFEDAEGSIWAGTDGSGLFRLRPRVVRTLTANEGLSADIVKSLTEDSQGRVWAVMGSGLHQLSAEPFRVVERQPVRSHYWVTSGDRNGYLWVGGYGRGVVRRRDGVEEPVVMSDGSRIIDKLCMALHVDRSERTWAGGNFGIWRIEGLAATQVIPTIKGLDPENKPVHAIAEDSDGKLYFGTRGDGLLIYDSKNWRHIHAPQGLSNNISAIHIDDSAAAWIGSPSFGLSRLKNGQVYRFPESAWELQALFTIIEDNQKQLWFGSNRGLACVSRADLDAFADGRSSVLNVRRYRVSDGLASTEFASGLQPTACKGKDGRLWFATLGGVAMVNPSEVVVNQREPPVQIEEVLADDAPAANSSDGKVIFAPGRRRLEFRYTAMSFVAPQKVHFRVKLDGFEDWREVGTLRSVSYNRVPPGEYRFQVAACNNDGVWNATGASLVVVLQPFFWQTPTFTALIVLLILASAAAVYVRIVQNLKRQRAAQHEFSRRLLEVQEAERKRIAGDLHDGLGQKLQLIRNRAFMALDPGVLPATASAQLQEISSITNEAIGEVRAITAALRPGELDEIGLTGALKWMIENVSDAAGLRILSEVDPIDGALSPENEMNFYRIVQEALNNVIKHAQATEVTVEIHRRDPELTLSLFDNGRGFDPAAQAPKGRSGLGLAGIGERVRILGGAHMIDSKIGAGTRLTITIPLRAK